MHHQSLQGSRLKRSREQDSSTIPSQQLAVETAPEADVGQPAMASNNSGHDFAKVNVFPAAERPSTEQGTLGAQIDNSLGNGKPLDAPVRRHIENALGADFSGVSIHTDAEADRFSRAVNAKAFTVGSDLYFRSGQYSPESPAGMRLLAHEATHVVQQNSRPLSGPSGADGVEISEPSDPLEQAARKTADEVVTVGSARGGFDSGGAGLDFSGASRTFVQRDGPVAAKPNSGAAIREVADHAVSRQDKVAKFASDALRILGDIDGYFDWVNGAYQRCWEHVTLVLQQANQQAADQAKIANFIYGLGMGVAVGQFYTLASALLEAGSMMREMSDLVRPFASGATSKALTSATTPPTGSPTTPRAVSPLLMQAKTFEKERDLYRNSLSLSADALQTFGPLIDAARQSENETEVDDAKMAAFLQADAKGALIEAKIDQAVNDLNILVQRRTTAAPDDRTIEQTIWVAHLAEVGKVQLVTMTWNDPGGTPNALANHLRDLGLIGVNWEQSRPEPQEVFVPDGEKTPIEGGWVQAGHTEKVEAPGEGLFQFTLYFPDSPSDGQKVCQGAMASKDWAQNATSAFLLESDANLVEARP